MILRASRLADATVPLYLRKTGKRIGRRDIASTFQQWQVTSNMGCSADVEGRLILSIYFGLKVSRLLNHANPYLTLINEGSTRHLKFGQNFDQISVLPLILRGIETFSATYPRASGTYDESSRIYPLICLGQKRRQNPVWSTLKLNPQSSRKMVYFLN